MNSGKGLPEDLPAVWVFHGDGARFASGVFASRADGLRWATEHRLTGLLTEYPVGQGSYDYAVSRGLFQQRQIASWFWQNDPILRLGYRYN